LENDLLHASFPSEAFCEIPPQKLIVLEKSEWNNVHLFYVDQISHILGNIWNQATIKIRLVISKKIRLEPGTSYQNFPVFVLKTLCHNAMT
jgi:hypothetical protein